MSYTYTQPTQQDGVYSYTILKNGELVCYCSSFGDRESAIIEAQELCDRKNKEVSKLQKDLVLVGDVMYSGNYK